MGLSKLGRSAAKRRELSQAHDTSPPANPVNAHMATRYLLGAALAAWFATAAMAQDGNVAAHLSAAALAEAKGDYAAALRELEAAEHSADETTRQQVQASVARLRQRTGQTPQTQEPARDPVQRLIDTLDTGSDADPAVTAAWTQLNQLGALAVPPLLERLPQLGPFGTRNALNLLSNVDDARIAPVLARLLGQGDPGLAITIGLQLAEMNQATALALATTIASGDYPAAVQLQAMDVFIKSSTRQEAARQLLQKLLTEPAAFDGLMDRIERGLPVGDEALAQIATHAVEPTKYRAVRHRLLHDENLTEERALAAMRELPDAWRASVGSELATTHRSWVNVGIIVLTVEPDRLNGEWVGGMEWWRGGDEAAKVILDARPVAERARRKKGSRNEGLSAIASSALSQMITAGWRMSAPLEPAMIAMARDAGWSTFVAALPVDGEARALAVWRQLGPNDRFELVDSAVRLQRPWHHLVVEQLATLTQPDGLRREWVARDWRAVDPETTALFARTVARWEREWPAARSNATTTTMASAQTNWRMPLNEACGTFGLPIAVLQPLVDAHDADAWFQLARTEPEAALTAAMSWPDISAIAGSLSFTIPRHGDARYVELLIRAMASIAANHSGWSSDVVPFLKSVGAGMPAVIALASPTRHPGLSGLQHDTALAAAYSARVADLPELLALMPQLDDALNKVLMDSLTRQLRPEHAPTLRQALGRLIDGPLAVRAGVNCPEPFQAERLLEALTNLGCEDAIAEARRILAHEDVSASLVERAAITCVELARTDRKALLSTLLADERPLVVQQALHATDLGQDVELRSLGAAAVRRLGDKLWSLDRMLENFAPEIRLAFAKSMIEDARFATFSAGVCQSLLAVIGAPKDGALAPAIARAANHPSADVRQATATALGRTFSKQAVPFLLELLKDDDDAVRETADKCLTEIASYLEAKAKWDVLLK